MPALTNPVVGVMGAVGGVGTSTLAAAVAAVNAGVLLDLDHASGGIDVLLGLEASSGPRWSGLRLGGGRLPPAALAERLPTWGHAWVLAADAVPDDIGVEVVTESAVEIGPVVFDLGRATSGTQQAAASLCGLLVVVLPADVAAAAAARSCLDRLPATLPVGAVVRRGSLPVEEVAALAGVRVLARVPACPARRAGPWSPRHLPRPLRRAAAGILYGAMS